ncbi:class I SAM-dependent methyltransferase [Peribacillus psychrosaccharolyticus]|uniref:Class I SAM-dependent methyltransferase n=1 Tax=Peribacillus psychrosaccharolyticus TaxID=1407 RepID=A0A974NPV5_PERPY|nr:class I SAM-dependent methyltransferase [Peribacillus psychrosaccharolyticus]MEC2057493.1 class I SAM-dependent methyltransferase [Peribacillus psychrosaccharolyticus]MED3745948.1 class I SAM-dependent methyltransferase [Peribacillus psychrosaccharolyticus]QQT01787.1 class I SAM-dependent methyltransferase [Peribacillus psychrosaccharolyticus]
MEYRGSSVYDNDDFLSTYLMRRKRQASPNNILEKPVLLQLIGEVRGKKVLDLGCGDAEIGKELLEAGCSFYEGVDGSVNMVGKAQQALTSESSRIHLASMEDWDFLRESYDLVISRLALHYLEDLQKVVQQIHHSLKPGGHFIFSVQHPILTSSINNPEGEQKRSSWLVDDYFKIGNRTEKWMGKDVIKYHRTIEEYFRIINDCGFRVSTLKECTPQRKYFTSEEEYLRRMRVPVILLMSCEKAG